jgi:hypothetical protein
MGNHNAPYENQLINQFAFATNYHAISLSGIRDYLGLMDGSTSITNFTAGCEPGQCYFPHSSLFTLLHKHGLTWKGYAESMPTGCDSTPYGVLPNEYWPSHTAIPYFSDLAKSCSKHDVPLGNVTLQTGNFFKDLKSDHFATFLMVTPNLCDDMHSCPNGESTVAMGDK